VAQNNVRPAIPPFTERQGPLYSLLSPADPHHKAGEYRALRRSTFLEALLQHLAPVYRSSFEAVFPIQFSRPALQAVVVVSVTAGCQKNCAPLDYCSASSGNSLPTFRDNLLIRYNPEERSSQWWLCLSTHLPSHCSCPLSDYSNNM